MLAVVLLASSCGVRREPRPGTEAEHAAYLREDPERARAFARLERYLERRGVGDVVPVWQLCRQGTDWRDARLPAFAIPPEPEWPHVVPTLRLVRGEVVPAVGPVEVVSGLPHARVQRARGRARASRHPRVRRGRPRPRGRAPARAPAPAARRVWRGPGRRRRMGLGLYAGTRFHVDTHRHRRW
ncbi:MAG: hypothetical protein M5U28_45125 [Sandaracinaceae bacterium]|nr:hypothetical protein [Sandaracinaceae bacterium]